MSPTDLRRPRSFHGKRRLALLLTALLLVSCEEPTKQELTIRFTDADPFATITASTDLGTPKKGSPQEKIVDDLRAALLAGRDEWSVRFAYAEPDQDRVTFVRNRGVLDIVERTAAIPFDRLQRFFFDTPLSVQYARGDGWNELTIYPGSSTRATPDQRRRVERNVGIFAERAVSYFGSIRTMYDYLDLHPQRAEAMFRALMDEKPKEGEPAPPPITEEEQSIVAEVGVRADALLKPEDPASGSLDRDFDVVYNPFPATMHVVIPSAPLEAEGFVAGGQGSFDIHVADAVEALASLEGRWVKPDPIAAALRGHEGVSAADFAATLAQQPRSAAPVVRRGEVAEALLERMRPAPRYRLRWIAKAATPASK